MVWLLESVIRRPGMYIPGFPVKDWAQPKQLTAESTTSWLWGLDFAAAAMGHEWDPELEAATWTYRQLDQRHSKGAEHQLRERGLPEWQIAQELLAMELEYWVSYLEKHGIERPPSPTPIPANNA
jgi:non-ribosomal peptide synthetase component F